MTKSGGAVTEILPSLWNVPYFLEKKRTKVDINYNGWHSVGHSLKYCSDFWIDLIRLHSSQRGNAPFQAPIWQVLSSFDILLQNEEYFLLPLRTNRTGPCWADTNKLFHFVWWKITICRWRFHHKTSYHFKISLFRDLKTLITLPQWQITTRSLLYCDNATMKTDNASLHYCSQLGLWWVYILICQNVIKQFLEGVMIP